MYAVHYLYAVGITEEILVMPTGCLKHTEDSTETLYLYAYLKQGVTRSSSHIATTKVTYVEMRQVWALGSPNFWAAYKFAFYSLKGKGGGPAAVLIAETQKACRRQKMTTSTLGARYNFVKSPTRHIRGKTPCYPARHVTSCYPCAACCKIQDIEIAQLCFNRTKKKKM